MNTKQNYSITNWLDSLAADFKRQGKDVYFQPFFYQVDSLAHTGNTTVSPTIVIDDDANFLLCTQSSVCFNTATGANVLSPNVLVSFFTEASQRGIQNAGVPISCAYGTGQRPYILIKPLMLQAKTGITVTIQSLTATQLDLRLTYGGVKAYLQRTR